LFDGQQGYPRELQAYVHAEREPANWGLGPREPACHAFRAKPISQGMTRVLVEVNRRRDSAALWPLIVMTSAPALATARRNDADSGAETSFTRFGALRIHGATSRGSMREVFDAVNVVPGRER